MVAVDTAHVGELRPLLAAGVVGQVVERLAEGGGLSDGEGARAVGVGGGGVFALAPVWRCRHRLGVVVELEGQDGMSGRDQLVIDLLLVVAEVTGKTAGGPD